MRVLIVEDEQISRELLRHTIESLGECDCVSNGREAIDAFHAAWDDRQPYDLIFLDIMMPDIDGHAVLKHIREFEKDKSMHDEDKAVRIIITTCLTDADNFGRAFEEGLQWYVTKPINRKQLIEVMSELGVAGADSLKPSRE